MVTPDATWWLVAYPPVLAGLLAGYGLLTRNHRPSYVCAALIFIVWGTIAGWRLYALARQLVVGLDQIVLSAAAFVLAVLISLGKSGHLRRWLTASGWLTAPTPPPGQSDSGAV
jgi:ABC-type dipeptide/oligopeptide/nickel transport system permease component